MSDPHPWTLYAETRDRLIALLKPLSSTQAEQTVPLTPGWTITEVVAHVCGLNADVAAGMREGLGTDERTSHQVNTRAGMSVESICGEWLGYADAMRAAIEDDGFFGLRLSADLIVHLHDLQHALGEPVDTDDEATGSGGRTYAARTPDRLVQVAGVALAVELGDGHRFEPADELGKAPAAVVLRATPYDFLRSVTGRRSFAQVRALDWSADPTPILDHFSPYGPLRTTDAAI